MYFALLTISLKRSINIINNFVTIKNSTQASCTSGIEFCSNCETNNNYLGNHWKHIYYFFFYSSLDPQRGLGIWFFYCLQKERYEGC